MPWDQFLGNRPNKPQSPNDVASRPLPMSRVSSSLDDVVPQMIIRSPRVRPGKFLFSDAKRLLQHNLGKADIAVARAQVRKLPFSDIAFLFKHREHCAARLWLRVLR